MVSKVLLPSIIGLICLMFVLPTHAERLQVTCGTGQIQINEVNYATAGDAEFVEISALPDFPLNNFELRLIDSSGSHYRRHSLAGETTSDLGFFVVKGNGHIDIPSIIDEQHVMGVRITNWIKDDTPGGIGIYDLSANEYCNFVNYGGTVDQFGDYLQIGWDQVDDGENRSCAYSFGRWGCNRTATPALSNSTLAVTLQNKGVVLTHPTRIILISALLMISTFFLLNPQHLQQSRRI